MKTAYLNAIIVDNEFIGVDIYSEKNPTTMSDRIYANITSVRAKTYQEARDKLVLWTDMFYPRVRWAR